MRFTFDPAKSAKNKVKHGIDFVDAQALWTDTARLERPVLNDTEPRVQVIGRIGPHVWSAFITYRHDTIRLISVRRARHDERQDYEDDHG